MGWFSRKEKAADQTANALTSVSDSSWVRIFDWLPGKWQQNSPLDRQDSVISHPVMYACITRIASDIAKLPFTIERMRDGIWEYADHPSALLLRKPNKYQNHIEFKENWVQSKLIWGNTYAYKARNAQGKIEELILLDPPRVMPLVSESGEVFYRLATDNLSRLYQDQITVPATEVIHDRMNALFHPLIGLSPLFAAEVSAAGGLAIHRDARKFFENGAKPSGILTSPGEISDSTADRLKETFENSYRGDRAGSVAVAGDGLTYQAMRMNSVDAQLVEQLNYTDEKICTAYHVPKHMVGVGPMPTHDNIEALTQSYYSDCLQIHMEKMEASLAEGVGLPDNYRIELDLDRLFRTDQVRKIEYLTKATGSPVMTPNEARSKVKLPKQDGGDTIYLQQQNYSLAALAQRDAENPLAPQAPAPAPENAMGPAEAAYLRAAMKAGGKIELTRP